MKEARYTLTSHCIESGRLRLTPSLRALLGGAERVAAVGPGGEELELSIDPETGELVGLAPLFLAGEFAPNDQIRFVREGDRIAIEPVGKRIRRRPELPKRETKRETPPPRATVTPYPKEVLYPEAGKRPAFVEALSALGLEAFPEGRLWRFRARMGRKGFSLVAAREGQGSPEELIAARAERGADFALWVVLEERPRPRSGLVVASEPALKLLAELHQSFPLGPIELMRLFSGGRVGLDEVERQKREVASLLGERAQFSAVLIALAGFRKDQVFLLEDLLPEVGEATTPDGVRRVLEILAGPPFFAVEALNPGEYRLRETVEALLDGLAAYAAQLKRRLPAPVMRAAGRG